MERGEKRGNGLMSVFSEEPRERQREKARLFLTLVAVSAWKASSYRTIERDRGVRESAYLNRIIPSNGREGSFQREEIHPLPPLPFPPP